jgi:Ca-activated chloride channel homolog
LEIKVSNFFAKVNSPVLTDVEIDFGRVTADLIYPRRTPDLFKGTQITLIGRYRNTADNISVSLKGKSGRENRSFNYANLSFPERAEQNDFLPRLWATRRVGWLMEQIRSNGEQKELRDEVVELGTRFGIVTPYTSYLAVDGQEVRGEVASSAPRARRMPSAQDKKSISQSSGAGAVQMSIQQNAQQANATVVVRENEDSIYFNQNVARQIGNKTFYNQTNNIWQDAEFKNESKLPEIKVQFASEEYFALLKREKELAQYFALGEEVVVVYKGNVYRVVK